MTGILCLPLSVCLFSFLFPGPLPFSTCVIPTAWPVPLSQLSFLRLHPNACENHSPAALQPPIAPNSSPFEKEQNFPSSVEIWCPDNHPSAGWLSPLAGCCPEVGLTCTLMSLAPSQLLIPLTSLPLLAGLTTLPRKLQSRIGSRFYAAWIVLSRPCPPGLRKPSVQGSSKLLQAL